jgi:hypothetical protein
MSGTDLSPLESLLSCPNGPSPSLPASLLVFSFAHVRLAPEISAILTSASVIWVPVTLSPCIDRQ